jgi:2-haloacid dehalogenase
LNRRNFVSLLAGGAATTALSTPAIAVAARSKIKVIAFDAFAVFDPRPVSALAEELFPGKSVELGSIWRTRQFEYGWLRTLSGQYVDFWQVTQDALTFACKSLKLDLSRSAREQLMQRYLEIKAWPDVLPALKSLKADGIRMAFLSNFTVHMLDRAVGNSGLEGFFEGHLSTDRVKAFKPDPRAYAMGTHAFGLRREEIAFAAFAGWDASGAKWFGYPTFWVNRNNAPIEELGVVPDAIGKDLSGVVAFARSSNS